MKKQKVIALLTAVICLAGCSASSRIEAVVLSQLSYSAFEALDRGEWEKAVGLFQMELNKEADFTSMMGLVKAQIGMEDYDSARETLLEIQRQYPDECLPLSYQGLVYEKLGDYESAATSYYEWASFLISKETETDTGNEQSEVLDDYSDLRLAIERFSENLWKIEDAPIIYNLAKGLYQSKPDNYDLLSNYMRSCSNLGDSVCGDELLDAVKGTDAEYIVTALVEAYRLAKEGDIDAAKERLFDPDHMDDRLSGIELDYGDMVNGKLEGVRVASQKVFDQWGAIIGSAVDDVWNGECEAWNVYMSATTITTRRGNEARKFDGYRYVEEIYSGTWKDGYPDGAFLEKEIKRYQFPEDPEENSEDRSETELQFVKGLAEGESVKYYLWEENGIWFIDQDSGITIHQFKEGKAIPFMAKTDDGELMVYECQTDFERKEAWFYETKDCGHSYIWEIQ